MMLAIVNSLFGWDTPPAQDKDSAEDDEKPHDEPNYLVLVNILTDLRLSMLRCLLTRSIFKRLFSDYDQVYGECL